MMRHASSRSCRQILAVKLGTRWSMVRVHLDQQSTLPNCVCCLSSSLSSHQLKVITKKTLPPRLGCFSQELRYTWCAMTPLQQAAHMMFVICYVKMEEQAGCQVSNLI